MTGAQPFLSVIPEIGLPALASDVGQAALALQFQLHRSQWWDGPTLTHHQFRQLRELVSHAVSQVPYYRDHLRRAGIFTLAGLTPTSFARWPVLRRADVQAQSQALQAQRLPAGHGAISWGSTTGSTGQPVRVAYTEAARMYHDASILRSQFWYELDAAGKFAAIRPGARHESFPDWGPPASTVFDTGPSCSFSIASDPRDQFEWLCAEDPDYLLSLGNNLGSLIEESIRTGRKPHRLRALLSFADRPPPGLREAARDVWDVPVFDTYSAAEFGTLALQCPSHDHLHVQSESVLLEVLRDDNTSCGPGETGRVVVTDLHNFAMPLIRYELGDYAEAGGDCPCGRGLPMLSRIAGRSSNMAVDPTGRRFWPLLSPKFWFDTPITQRQLIQKSPQHIEVRYVAHNELDPQQREIVAAGLSRTLRYPFEYEFVRVPAIPRPPGGKFEEFISEITA